MFDLVQLNPIVKVSGNVPSIPNCSCSKTRSSEMRSALEEIGLGLKALVPLKLAEEGGTWMTIHRFRIHWVRNRVLNLPCACRENRHGQS